MTFATMSMKFWGLAAMVTAERLVELPAVAQRLNQENIGLFDVGLDLAHVDRFGFKGYVERAWVRVRPHESFIDGWHIDAICEHLEAIKSGEIRNLIINVPPRHTKSLLTSVFFPTYCWIDLPGSCWLTASYAIPLAVRDATRSRRLMQSPWWQARWGSSFKFAGDQNQKSRYENNQGGHRIAIGVTGMGTGEGGDFIIVDDPVKVADADSDLALDNANTWWAQTMSTRTNDPRTAAKVVIMQRLHENDLTGHLLDEMKHGGEHYELLRLPAEFEPNRHFVTSIGWSDPRTEEGELLNPERFGKRELANLKAVLGEQATAGQLQQRPAPAGGAIFQRKWWEDDNRYDPNDTALWQTTVGRWLSIDTALKDKETNDYHALGVWEMTKDYRLVLREAQWKRLQFPQLADWIQEEALRWRGRDFLKGILIEDKVSGTSALQTLRQEAPEWLADLLIGFEPRGSKEGRARQAALWCDRGCILLPEPSTGAPWLFEFEEDFLYKFPMGKFDDPVDQLSQMVIYLEHYLAQGWRSRVRVEYGDS